MNFLYYKMKKLKEQNLKKLKNYKMYLSMEILYKSKINYIFVIF